MSSKDKKKQTSLDKTWLGHEDFSQWVAAILLFANVEVLWSLSCFVLYFL